MSSSLLVQREELVVFNSCQNSQGILHLTYLPIGGRERQADPVWLTLLRREAG